jgi:hypothetical protein
LEKRHQDMPSILYVDQNKLADPWTINNLGEIGIPHKLDQENILVNHKVKPSNYVRSLLGKFYCPWKKFVEVHYLKLQLLLWRYPKHYGCYLRSVLLPPPSEDANIFSSPSRSLLKTSVCLYFLSAKHADTSWVSIYLITYSHSLMFSGLELCEFVIRHKSNFFVLFEKPTRYFEVWIDPNTQFY